MFKRPSYGIWQVWTEKHIEPRKHDDVVLEAGECIGIVIGNRRYVISIGKDGYAEIATQRKVTKWVYEEN